jgi:TonB family protein
MKKFGRELQIGKVPALACIAVLFVDDAAISSPPEDDGTQYQATQRSDYPEYLASITRLTACKIPGTGNLPHLPSELYPEQSRRQHEEGTVTVQLIFDVNSCVRKATIVQSSGHYRLDNVSLKFAMTLKFPATTTSKLRNFVDGQPTVAFPIAWKLLAPKVYARCSAAGAKCVDAAPPPPKMEEIGASPEPGYIWMPGYYAYYAKTGYQWNDGDWQPPRPGYHWNAPHWEHIGATWVFTPGDWERDN